MEDDLSDVIYKILENSPFKVYEGWYRKDLNKKCHTVFKVVGNTIQDCSDDEIESVELQFQFSTFGGNKKEVLQQRKYVRKILKKNGFLLYDMNEDQEEENELYHYADRFHFYINVNDDDEEEEDY